MDDIVTQLGVGGILVILVLKEVLSFVRDVVAKRNGDNDKSNGHTKIPGSNTVANHVDEALRQQRLVSTLERLSENITASTRALEQLHSSVTAQTHILDTVEDHVADIRSDIKTLRVAGH